MNSASVLQHIPPALNLLTVFYILSKNYHAKRTIEKVEMFPQILPSLNDSPTKQFTAIPVDLGSPNQLSPLQQAAVIHLVKYLSISRLCLQMLLSHTIHLGLLIKMTCYIINAFTLLISAHLVP